MAQTIPFELRERVRLQAKNRCGYCLTRQDYIPWELEIEHIFPLAKGGSNNEDNLRLACRSCNLFKATQIDAIDPITGQRVNLFNPRFDRWTEHFHWSKDGTLIVGLSQIGRATVIALNLNLATRQF